MTAATKPRFVRADGPDKVTGSGRYTADLTLTGMLAAKFRYADIAHARITRLDVSAARAMPGVMAVYNLSQYMPEKLVALNMWCERLEHISYEHFNVTILKVPK